MDIGSSRFSDFLDIILQVFATKPQSEVIETTQWVYRHPDRPGNGPVIKPCRNREFEKAGWELVGGGPQKIKIEVRK